MGKGLAEPSLLSFSLPFLPLFSLENFNKHGGVPFGTDRQDACAQRLALLRPATPPSPLFWIAQELLISYQPPSASACALLNFIFKVSGQCARILDI